MKDTLTKPDPPIADLVAEVERHLPPDGKSTPWTWKMWGSRLLAYPEELVDTVDPNDDQWLVCWCPRKPEPGGRGSHVADLYLIAAMRRAIEPLIKFWNEHKEKQ